MNRSTPNLVRVFPILVLMILGMLGCDDTLNPIVGEDRPFTIWGYFNAKADTQMVRVFAIEERLGLDRDGPIDATVYSIDLNTEERFEWRDSLISFDEKSFGHVFWAPFRAVPEHAYRLVISRSDGETSTVEVTVPPPVEVVLDRQTGFTAIPVEIIGDNLNLINVEVEYDAVTMTTRNPWPPGTPPDQIYRYPVSIPYADLIDETDFGVETTIDMISDFDYVQTEFARRCLNDQLIGIRKMVLKFLVADPAWVPPGGVFDAAVLSQPGVFSNVENGFGYYGAGLGFTFSWVPPTDAQQAAGFTTSAPCGFMPADIPICYPSPEACFDEE